MHFESYQDFLKDEFERRKTVNSSYSLRSFARDLEMSPSRLSQILARKVGLSIKGAHETVSKLGLNSKDSEWFISSVGASHARGISDRQKYIEKVRKYKTESFEKRELSLEYFKVISDWHHFAILELTYLKGFQNDPEWIAKTLDINVSLVTEAIARLKKLELAKEENGKLVDCFFYLATPNDTPSQALRKYTGQLLKKASVALECKVPEEREFSSSIMSISKADLPAFKEKIREFRRDLEPSVSTNKPKDAVYCLNLQFFNLVEEDL